MIYSEDSSESFSVDHRKDNYKKTSIFVNYLKDNGYSISEGQLGLFRFTASTNINSPRASFSIK
jgi:hypothetical protein